MTIGEIVEALISLHDSGKLSRSEDYVVCAACNILSKLPCGTSEEDAKKKLAKAGK